MGVVVPKTCWASNKICNENHLLHLVGILFPHIKDNHFVFTTSTGIGKWNKRQKQLIKTLIFLQSHMTLDFSKIHSHPSPWHVFAQVSFMYCGSYKADTLQWNMYPSFPYMSIFHKYHSFIVVSINLTPLKLFHNCHFPAFISPPSSVPSHTMVRGFSVFGSYVMHVTIFN